MAKQRTKSQTQKLENYRIALDNVVNQPEIAETMAEFMYDQAKVAEGKALLQATIEAFDFNHREDAETVIARAVYDKRTKTVSKMYSLHRKKAKVAFRNDDVAFVNLNLKGSIPQAFANWISIMKIFYNGMLDNEAYQQKIMKLKVSTEDLQEGLLAIINLEKSRSEYMRERGESQDATNVKDTAFAKLDDWMNEFLDIAIIALEDNPQLLEALCLKI